MGSGIRFVGRLEGQWNNDTYFTALKEELGKYDLNSAHFINDIARSFVRADVPNRASLDRDIDIKDQTQ